MNSDPLVPLSSRLSKDKLMMLDREIIAAEAFKLLDGMAHQRPEASIAGLATAFAAFSMRVNMDPSELFAVGLKVLREPQVGHRNSNALVEALKEFANMKARDGGSLI